MVNEIKSPVFHYLVSQKYTHPRIYRQIYNRSSTGVAYIVCDNWFTY